MPNPSSTPPPEPSSSSFQRGGQQLTVSKVADRFTVRLKRGADAQSLVSPSGKLAGLHQRDGGSAHDIKKTYTSATTPDLQALRGEPIQGNWKLEIADLEARDEGKLNRWGVKIVRQP